MRAADGRAGADIRGSSNRADGAIAKTSTARSRPPGFAPAKQGRQRNGGGRQQGFAQRMAEHDDAERPAPLPVEMARGRGVRGMGDEPLAEEAQCAQGGRQHEHTGRACHDDAGRRQTDEGEGRVAAERNMVDQPPGKGEGRAADECTNHVERAEFGMAEREFRPDGGAEQTDIEGLPEAGEAGQQQAETEKRRIRGDETEIGGQDVARMVVPRFEVRVPLAGPNRRSTGSTRRPRPAIPRPDPACRPVVSEAPTSHNRPARTK